MVFHLDRPYPPHPGPPIVSECDITTVGTRGDLIGIAAISVLHEDGDNGGQQPHWGLVSRMNRPTLQLA